MTPQEEVKQISIRLLPDGFSFLNQFHPIQPGADFRQRLEEGLLDTLTQSSEDEPSGTCLIESMRFCLSPTSIDQDSADQMYHFTLPEPELEETVITQDDEEFGLRFSFGIDSHLHNFLQRNWPELTLSHPLFELITDLAHKVQADEACMVAEAKGKVLHVLVFRNKQLQMANSFEAATNDDCLYHIMNCWTQHGLDVVSNKIYLLTDNQELRQQVGQYIKLCES